MNYAFKTCVALVFSIAMFSSCTKEIENKESESNLVTTNFLARSNDTRTVFGDKEDGGYPVIWTEGSVKSVLAYKLTKESGSSQEVSAKNADVTVLSGGQEASFNVTNEADPNKSEYKYLAVSPASAYSSYAPSSGLLQVEILDSQTPLTNSVDEAAQVLVAKDPVTYADLQSSISFSFKHAVAYAKMELENLTIPDGATISNYVLTASSNIAGKWNYDFATNTMAASAGKNVITLTGTNVQNNVFWFAIAPADLRGGTLKITVNTSAGPIEKTINFPASGNAGNFQRGHVSSFIVNMEGLTPQNDVVFSLVENVSSLVIGSQVIIAANGTKNVAMSTTQNPNNRAQTPATKSSDLMTITNPSDAVQIFTLEAGSVTGTYAFHCVNGSDGYIYAASSSSNYLRTKESKDANGSWTISISNKEATVTAQGTNTNKVLRYNSSSSLFSCYASGQETVFIYQKSDGSSPVDPQPTVNAPTFDPNGGTFNSATEVTVTSTTDGATIYYTINGSDPTTSTTTTVANGGTVTINSSCTLKAIAVKDGVSSTVSSADFVINNSGTYTSPVSFSVADFAGQGTSGSGGQLLVEKSPITVSSAKGYCNGDEHVRIYQNGTLTISASGKTITKIILTSTNSGDQNYGIGKISLANSSSGSFSTSGKVGTWTGSSTSVTFNAVAQFRFTDIEVTYN